MASLIYFLLYSILSVIHCSPRNSFTIYLIKVFTYLNMLFSKATVVLFVITLKLETDNPSHYYIIWVLVLLSQFVHCVIKCNVIACDNLFNTVLISF